MTSTEFTIGLDGTRVSSKVLKPPGGGSSDIFGLGVTQYTKTSSNQHKAPDSSTKNRLFGEDPFNSNLSTPQKYSSSVNINEKSMSASKNQYVRRNPITGEGIGYPVSEKIESYEKENKDVEDIEKTELESKPEIPEVCQTGIRVRNPPGGKSSGIF